MIMPKRKTSPTPKKKPSGITPSRLQLLKPFDPEGSGYDYVTSLNSGVRPGRADHYGNRDPKTGMLLKGRKHRTWDALERIEREAGYRIFKHGARYYSEPKKH